LDGGGGDEVEELEDEVYVVGLTPENMHSLVTMVSLRVLNEFSHAVVYFFHGYCDHVFLGGYGESQGCE
jgi:hypothetical protein